MKTYPYTATLFRAGGTVCPPAGRRLPALPPLESIPAGWPATAAMGGHRDGCGLVPPGAVRVIFGTVRYGETDIRVAFDMAAAEYRRVCGGPSCGGKTAGDFRGVPTTPAPAAFY